MTTIAWSKSHGCIASDRQSSYHRESLDKLFTLPDGSVVGVSGNYECWLQAVEYWKGGVKPEMPEDAGTALRVYQGGYAEMYHSRLVSIPVSRDFIAIGSGRDYAMGAMARGASPEDAVRIAGMFDENTGPVIDVKQIA